MKLKLIASITFCLLFFKSYSQDQAVWDKSDPTWDWVGSNENSFYLIKKSYETKSDDEITVWIKVMNSAIKVKSKTTKAATIDKVLYGFDCRGKKLKVMAYANYSMSGKLIKQRTFEDYEQKWINVVPETVGEMLFLKACAME